MITLILTKQYWLNYQTDNFKFAERMSKVENHKLEDNNILIDFNKTKEITVPGMNNGTGMMTVKMYMDAQDKIILCAIHKGGFF